VAWRLHYVLSSEAERLLEKRNIVMNTKALITVLATLGTTSSLAMARPAAQATVTTSAQLSWNHTTPVRTTPVRTYPAPAPVMIRDHRPVYTRAPIVVRPVINYGVGADWTRTRGWDYQPRATLLAEGLTYNTGEYRKDIVLEGRGTFNTLTVNEDRGCNFIKEVRIEYIGGAVQSIPVNRTLDDHQSLTFDLDGTNRNINRIFVYRADGNNMNIGFPSGGELSVTAQ
jgi:hypothetical protein